MRAEHFSHSGTIILLYSMRFIIDKRIFREDNKKSRNKHTARGKNTKKSPFGNRLGNRVRQPQLPATHLQLPIELIGISEQLVFHLFGTGKLNDTIFIKPSVPPAN